MKRTLAILIGVVGLVSGFGGDVNACDEMSSRLVARSYVLAMPLQGRDNELIPLMQSNPGYFTQGGGAIRCMQRLGTALLEGALASSRQFSGSSAQERFGSSMPEGLANLPGQIDTNMRSYGSDMFTMGNELLWLAKVLPAAAQGNFTPYSTTGTDPRQMMSQVQPIYQMLCQTDPTMCQMALSIVREMAPLIEQQIYALARQLGN